MSVYFTELHTWPNPTPLFARHEHALLSADTTEELHELAARIGLRPEWARTRDGVTFYELTAGKRDAAKRAGAGFMCEVEQRARRVGLGA